jgi:hypothetical protein
MGARAVGRGCWWRAAVTKRAALASSERVHETIARGLRVLGGKRKDMNMGASIYRLKHISNRS